jgi:hypothetical protein
MTGMLIKKGIGNVVVFLSAYLVAMAWMVLVILVHGTFWLWDHLCYLSRRFARS